MWDILETVRRIMQCVFWVLIALAVYWICVLFQEIGQVLEEHGCDTHIPILLIVEIIMLVINFILIHVCDLNVHCRQDAESKLIGHRTKYAIGAILPSIVLYFMCIVSVIFVNVFSSGFVPHIIVLAAEIISTFYTVLCTHYNKQLYTAAFRAYLALDNEEVD